jgi:hypothetical protein
MKWKTKLKTTKTKIMADRTMPPNDPMPTPDSGMGVAEAETMSPDMTAPEGDGSVMISMPKDAFDAVHQLIVQLAQGVDQLAQAVGQQKAAGEVPAAEMPPAGPEGGAAGAGSDEDFLKGIAEAGSVR